MSGCPLFVYSFVLPVQEDHPSLVVHFVVAFEPLLQAEARNSSPRPAHLCLRGRETHKRNPGMREIVCVRWVFVYVYACAFLVTWSDAVRFSGASVCVY